MKKDYYKILGVPANSTLNEIRIAYRKLALKYHPDKNKSKDAHSRMQEINEAYRILSNKEKKGKYDANINKVDNKPKTYKRKAYSNIDDFFSDDDPRSKAYGDCLHKDIEDMTDWFEGENSKYSS